MQIILKDYATQLQKLLDNKYLLLDEYNVLRSTLFISYAVTSRTNAIMNSMQRKDYSLPKLLKMFKRVVNIYRCEKEKGLYQNLYIDSTEQYIRKFKQFCNSKHCLVCSKRRSVKNAKRFTQIISQYEHPRFMTVSFKNIEDFSDLKLISGQFMRLRELLSKTYQIKNYVAVLEITHSKHGWHPHYHMIYDGSYISKHILREKFKKVTKSVSHHVDIQYIQKNQISNPKRAAFYVSKYLTKEDSINSLRYAEYSIGTHNVRFVKIYGINKKKLSSYYDLYSYIKKNIQEMDPNEYYMEIFNEMSKNYITIYDTTMSIEENASKYFPDHLVVSEV